MTLALITGCCEYCGEPGARPLEFAEEGISEPEVFSVCGGCMFAALMHFGLAVERGMIVLEDPG